MKEYAIVIRHWEDYRILGYVRRGLESFAKDPADSDYQSGYEAALQDILNFSVTGAPIKRPDSSKSFKGEYFYGLAKD